MERFEYALVRQSRDPQKTDDPRVDLAVPGDTQFKQMKIPGSDGAHFLDFLNRMGVDGWELIGPPSVRNVAMTYKNDQDHWMDFADWSQRDFWLKRVVR